MFILDDVILRALGFSLQPFDMIWLLELIRDYGLREKYDIKKINNRIKENRLLLELGELDEAAYKEQHESLMRQLRIAQEIEEMLSKVSIREGNAYDR
ncbi:hypothetical protein HYY74_07170 [Candidatus Woesearchaeota archaeon]|nr:hypothetical protein [Candidatus Woesearchaeota archaeon]